MTRFVDVQAQVAELVSLELSDLQNRIRYGDGASTSPILADLENMWVRDFEPVSQRVRKLEPELAADCAPLSWDQIRDHLVSASQRIQVKTINGSAQDALDYSDHSEGLSVLAIGGDKLSRGLTLEGLSVSYYLRSSLMYDTLLQMGRWFGYRPGYLDLCRLHTSEDLAEAYSYITMAIEELRQDFDVMADRGMTPSEFGLRVRTHPAGLIITATNKMRFGTRMSVSFAGGISETISFDRNAKPIRDNYARFGRFLRNMQGEPAVENQNRIWRGVSGDRVADLLAEIEVHPSSQKVRGDLLAHYIRSQIQYGGLTDWTVVLVSNPGDQDEEIGGYPVRPVLRAQHPNDARDKETVYRIRRLVSPTDEMLDLSEAERKRAKDDTIQFFRDHATETRYQSEPTRAGGKFIRHVRNSSNGLILLYPLEEPNDLDVPFVGFAVSFPGARRDTPVEYMVNTVYWHQELEE